MESWRKREAEREKGGGEKGRKRERERGVGWGKENGYVTALVAA